uniref:Granule associated Rac and RHOG effector 1 n=1 Tax=Cyprinus carpio TaxID=7962 RepID=A0A8C1GC01_CYPCA
MYCCSAQESKMDYKLRFLLGGSKHKVQQHQHFQLPELSRTLSAPLGSSCSTPSPMATIGPSPSGCHAPPSGATTAIADIQQGISKYLDALNAFCRASAFLTELFGSVFRDSRYSKAAMQLKDVQEHVMETTSRLTTAIKPEIGKMLMELSAGAANFKDQNDFSRQDVEVLGRCFLTVMQVHFQFLSQALQKVQPVAQSCLAEALAQVQERHGNAHAQNTSPGPLSELDEAVRSWKGASEVTACLRERGRDSCLSGIQVQQLFCSQNTSIPEHQLKELNANIDNALQVNPTVTVSTRTSDGTWQIFMTVCTVQLLNLMMCVCVCVQVVVDTAQIENKEAYAPQISLEGSKVVIQVPSTWCLKEDPATMSLLQRSLDPEKTLGLVDVLYTAVFDLQRWKERKEQTLPTIQIQLQRDTTDYGGPVDLPPGNSTKSSGGLPKTISKLTSRFTKKASSNSSAGGSYSIPSTPSRSSGSSDDKSSRLHSLLQMNSMPCTPDPSHAQNANGASADEQGMNLPTDQEMQDVIDFLSGFNMGKSQQASPLVKRRNSVASTNAADLKPPSGAAPLTSQSQVSQMLAQTLQQQTQQQQQQQQQQQLPSTPKQQQTQPNSQTLPFYQHLLQPIGQPQQPQQTAPVSPQLSSQQPPQQRAPSKWPQGPLGGLSPIGPLTQWPAPGLPDLSSDLYSLGLVSTYMDSMMSEMLGHKPPQGPRNNTWPNRDQSDQSLFGVLGDSMPFDPAVGSDPEFARYVAGVNQAMQQKRQAQHVRRPSNTRSNWPHPDEQHRGWTHPEYYSEGEAVNSGWSANQGDSASSSDETSSANGDSLFSMFSGPDLVAAVKQRRKHSCGEQEVCTLPSPPLHHASDDSNQDSKTKTWPPKAPWQHSSHTNTMPNPSSSLYQMTIPSSQWGDSMQMLQSPVWSTANDCPPSSGMSSGFPFTQQQQQQQQQVSQHKILSKGFKTFPLKPEHRPSYLHQY